MEDKILIEDLIKANGDSVKITSIIKEHKKKVISEELKKFNSNNKSFMITIKSNEDVRFYPVSIKSEGKSLLQIQTFPKQRILFKGKEITEEKLIRILDMLVSF